MNLKAEYEAATSGRAELSEPGRAGAWHSAGYVAWLEVEVMRLREESAEFRRMHLTPERLAEIKGMNKLARVCAADCPGPFLAPIVGYVDELLAEVERLRAELAECQEVKRLLAVENAELRAIFMEAALAAEPKAVEMVLGVEVKRLRALNEGLAERAAAQSELLTRRAQKETPAG